MKKLLTFVLSMLMCGTCFAHRPYAYSWHVRSYWYVWYTKTQIVVPPPRKGSYLDRQEKARRAKEKSYESVSKP